MITNVFKRIFMSLLIMSLSACSSNSDAFEMVVDAFHKQDVIQIYYNYVRGPNKAGLMFDEWGTYNYYEDFDLYNNEYYEDFIQRLSLEEKEYVEELFKAYYEEGYVNFFEMLNSLEVKKIEQVDQRKNELMRFETVVEDKNVRCSIFRTGIMIVYEFEGKDMVGQHCYEIANIDDVAAYVLKEEETMETEIAATVNKYLPGRQ